MAFFCHCHASVGLGVFFVKKQRMLEVFLATEDARSPMFPDVWGADWSGSPNSRCHGDVCDRAVVSRPANIRPEGQPSNTWPVVLLSATAHEQLLEFNILRTGLEHHCATRKDDLEDTSAAPGHVVAVACEDPRAELRALKVTVGGLLGVQAHVR